MVSTVKSNQAHDKTWHDKELLEIAQYLCEMFANEHDLEREAFEQEWNKP